MSFALKRYILAGGVFLAALVSTGIYLTGRWHAKLDAAQVQVTAARSEAQRALAEAAVADVFARGAEARGDSLATVVAVLKLSEKRARISDSASRQVFAATAGSAPDTCKPVIEAAQAALASAARLDTLDKARADTAQLEANSYRESARAALVALANLEHGAARLDSATGVLSRQAKGPSFLARIAPKIGAGTAFGLNPQGRFDTVAGITLGWTFR